MATKRKANTLSAKAGGERKPGHLKWYYTLFSVCCLGTGLFLAAWYVEEHVSDYSEFNLAIEQVELDARCHWLPEEARKQVKSAVLSLKDLNLLSEEVLWEVEEGLSRTPWVKEVGRVEKVFPRSIRFSLVLRRPIAWVSRGGSTHLVDTDGTRLPISDRNAPEITHLPVIEGVPSSMPSPLPGARWHSRQVEAGIHVAVCLQAAAESDSKILAGVKRIDVRDARSKGRGVVLITHDNRRLEWGKTPLPGEIPLISEEQKLANLRLVLRGEASVENRSYYLLWTTPLTAGPRIKATDNPK